MNVPDDWGSYYRTCYDCGEKYHLSEGGHECPPPLWPEEEDEIMPEFTPAQKALTKMSEVVLWSGQVMQMMIAGCYDEEEVLDSLQQVLNTLQNLPVKVTTCHPDDIPF